MAPGQDWCLQCGAGAPGGGGSPGWRGAATILGVAAVLALGAAAAAYAALSSGTPKPRTVTTAVAQVTPPAATTPVTPVTPVPTIPSVKSTLPPITVKPPKIPLTATPTPKGTNTSATPSPSGEGTTTTKTTPSSTNAGGAGGEEAQPSAILLDTNAASTYNPYNYPESDFGDPSLTIDGDATTAWTAIVEPAAAPKMADGVLIELKTPHKLGALELVTSSPGMTVQVYGADAKTAPTSITDPAWVPLSHSQVLAKKHVRIKLRNQKKPFTFVALWISKAPAASVGTPEAPGHVSVNEIELFPAH